uniref:Secreted protein n=1 Tax=Trichogramma kaykai TaxID=54128 RepID=A0ABD2X1V7_9HYME
MFAYQAAAAAAAEERKQEQLAAPAAALITDEPCFNRPTTTSYIYTTCAKQMRKIVSGALRTPTRPSTAHIYRPLPRGSNFSSPIHTYI